MVLLPLGEGWDGASGAGEGLRVAGEEMTLAGSYLLIREHVPIDT